MAAAIGKLPVSQQPAAAKAQLLPLRISLVRLWEQCATHQQTKATSYGGMGSLHVFESWAQTEILWPTATGLAHLLREPLPASAYPSRGYLGQPRLFVHPVRRAIGEEEGTLTLTARVLSSRPPARVW